MFTTTPLTAAKPRALTIKNPRSQAALEEQRCTYEANSNGIFTAPTRTPQMARKVFVIHTKHGQSTVTNFHYAQRTQAHSTVVKD